jgi:hypothetical protein
MESWDQSKRVQPSIMPIGGEKMKAIYATAQKIGTSPTSLMGKSSNPLSLFPSPAVGVPFPPLGAGALAAKCHSRQRPPIFQKRCGDMERRLACKNSRFALARKFWGLPPIR